VPESTVAGVVAVVGTGRPFAGGLHTDGSAPCPGRTIV